MNRLHQMIKNDYERKIAIPNEIITDTAELPFKERAFFVTYYYFITYLYLYAKYGEDLSLESFNQKNTADFLKIDKNGKVFRNVTKANGHTDNLGYTTPISDPPTAYYFQDEDVIDYNHTFFSETTQNLKYRVPPKTKFKFPIKAYFRSPEDMNDKIETGTIVDPSETVIISVKTFHKFFKKNNLTFHDFFVYVWIVSKSRNNKTVIAGVIAEEDLFISKKSYYESIKRLSENGLISKFTTKQKDNPRKNTPLIIHVLKQ